MDLRALIFMPALAGAAICVFVFLLFLSGYYLTILESTAAGAKEVTWIPESPLDHLPKLIYLLWLFGLWITPALVVGRALTAGVDSSWLNRAAPLLVFWLCYPVSQLSSLSATSIWYPLVPDVFARLAQKPGIVLGFLVLSAVVLVPFAVAFKWTFQTTGDWPYLFAGAPLLVLSSLIYARLLGRLAFALRFTKGLFPAKKRKKPKPRVKQETDDEPKRPRTQPRDMVPLDTPEGELAGYDVKFEDEAPPPPRKRLKATVVESESEPGDEPEVAQARPRKSRPAPETAVERGKVWTDDDDDESAYGVHEAEVQPEDRIPEELVRPSALEMRLLSREDAPKKPKRVWNLELFAFLAQPNTVSALLIASALCFAAGVMVRVCRAFSPYGEE